jgi:pyruvate,water dikinase
MTPPADHARRARERQELTGHCCRRLRNPLKRALFRRALARSQWIAVMRENWKDAAVRMTAQLRRLLLVLGATFARTGRLDRPDDIFFLELTELAPVASNPPDPAVHARIRDRRATYAQNLPLAPPPVVVGRFDPARTVPAGTDLGRRWFKGLTVWPGVVTGRARVIGRTERGQTVAHGEILVAATTDPAWTPYILPAAGMVTDQGGLLSHGSILAREFGIPAITNVGPASRVIRTGQPLRLDATAGTVLILDEDPAATAGDPGVRAQDDNA